MSKFTNVFRSVLVSAARTVDTTSAEMENRDHKGVIVTIDRTAAAATPSVVFNIQGYDEESAKWYTILASAAITGVGTTVLHVYPGMTAAANLIANAILPTKWRVFADVADADSLTYSVGAVLVK